MTQRDYAKRVYQVDKSDCLLDEKFKELVIINKELILDDALSVESKCELIRLIGKVFDTADIE